MTTTTTTDAGGWVTISSPCELEGSGELITHTVILCASISSKFMKIKGNLMICEKNKPAYQLSSNVKITTSVKMQSKKIGSVYLNI